MLIVVCQGVVRIKHRPLRQETLAELWVRVAVVNERRVAKQRRSQTPETAAVLPRQAVHGQQRASERERERLGRARGQSYEQAAQVALEEVARVAMRIVVYDQRPTRPDVTGQRCYGLFGVGRVLY